MGLFSTLLEKLGIKKPEANETPKGAANATVGKQNLSTQGARPAPGGPPPGQGPHGIPPQDMHGGPGMPPGKPPMGMPMVDVAGKLDKLASANPEKLDWKKSIVDLLKLVGMDSSLQARKEMAQELGCPANLMGGDYAEMNMWLHREVLRKIAENGGNIPQDLIKN